MGLLDFGISAVWFTGWWVGVGSYVLGVLIFDLVLLAFCQFSLISFAVISFGCGFGVNCVCWLACLVLVGGWVCVLFGVVNCLVLLVAFLFRVCLCGVLGGGFVLFLFWVFRLANFVD